VTVRRGWNRRVHSSVDLKKTRNVRDGQTAGRDTHPSEDERVRFLVRENLEDADEDIAKYGDEDDRVILFTDQYTIYDGIDEYDEIDGYLAVNHNEHYVVDDAHTNSCENRHSFFRNGLRSSEASQNTTYRRI
jgi:hypothetical protein